MILTLIYKPMYSIEIIKDILNRCLTKDEVSVHCIINPTIAELEDFFHARLVSYNHPHGMYLVCYQGELNKPVDIPCIVMHDDAIGDYLYLYDVEEPV